MSTVQYTHVLFSEASEWVPAMEKIKRVVAGANITGFVQDGGGAPVPHTFPMSARYVYLTL